MTRIRTALSSVARFLDCWHWVLLILAAPFLLFPSPARTPALLIVPGVWVLAWLVRRESLPLTPFNGELLLLGVMMLVSLWATYDVAISLPKIAGMVLGLGTFYATVRASRRPQGWGLSLLVFLAIGAGMAGFGLIGTKWLLKVSFLTPIVSRIPARITGLPGAEEGLSANQLAGALLWVAFPLLTHCISLVNEVRTVRSVLGRWKTLVLISFMIVATFFVTGMIVLTQSRGGYIGFTLGGLVLVLGTVSARWRKLLLGGLAILAIALVFAALRQGPEGVTRGLLGKAAAEDPVLSTDTFDFRLEVWSRALDGIQDFPFTGMGMNTFRHVVHVLYPLFLVGPDYDIAHAHNEFLQAALDLGIPGLIAFLALYISALGMLREIWQFANRQSLGAGGNPPASIPHSPLSTLYFSPSTLHALVLGFGSGLIAHMVYGMTDAVALGAKPGILFWMLLGLIAALFEQVRSSEPEIAEGTARV